MTRDDALGRARELLERRAWGEAHAALSAVDTDAGLGAADLERLAIAAYMIGRDDDATDAWGRAHRQWLRESELRSPEWTFGPVRAAAIRCPVLSVLGTETTQLFVGGRELLHTWFRDCQDADIVDTTHLLQVESPRAVADAISVFPSRR